MAACEERSNCAKTQSWCSGPLPFPFYFRFFFFACVFLFNLFFFYVFFFYVCFLFSFFLFWLRQKLKLSCVFFFYLRFFLFTLVVLFCLRFPFLFAFESSEPPKNSSTSTNAAFAHQHLSLQFNSCIFNCIYLFVLLYI